MTALGNLMLRTLWAVSRLSRMTAVAREGNRSWRRLKPMILTASGALIRSQKKVSPWQPNVNQLATNWQRMQRFGLMVPKNELLFFLERVNGIEPSRSAAAKPAFVVLNDNAAKVRSGRSSMSRAIGQDPGNGLRCTSRSRGGRGNGNRNQGSARASISIRETSTSIWR